MGGGEGLFFVFLWTLKNTVVVTPETVKNKFVNE